MGWFDWLFGDPDEEVGYEGECPACDEFVAVPLDDWSCPSCGFEMSADDLEVVYANGVRAPVAVGEEEDYEDADEDELEDDIEDVEEQ